MDAQFVVSLSSFQEERLGEAVGRNLEMSLQR